MKVQIEQPVFYVVVLLLIALASSWFLYRKNTLDLPKASFWGLRVLRAVSIFLLFILVLNPFVEYVDKTLEKPVLILGVDNSKSISEGMQSDSLSLMVSDIENRLSDKFNLKKVTVAKELAYNDSLLLNGSRTNLGAFVQQVNQYSKDKVVGAVLLSDGIYNEGFNPSVLAEKSQVPISTLLLGDTTKRLDVKIADVRHNETVRKGNETTVRITVKTSFLPSYNTTISLKEGSTLIEQKTVVLDANASKELVFTLPAKENGLHNYTFSIPALEGELNTLNNTKRFSIEVVDTQSEILVVYDALHPDVGLFSSVFANVLNYKVQNVDISNLTKAQVLNADLVVLRLLNGSSQSKYNQLAKAAEKPALYFYPKASAYFPLEGVELNAKRTTNFVYPALNGSFDYFLSANLQDQFSNVPALEVPFGDYKLNANWKNLFQQNLNGLTSDLTLVAVNKDTKPAKAIFIGAGYWAWRMNVFARTKSFEAFDTFILKITDVLIQAGKNEPLVVDIPQFFSIDDAIDVKAFVYNELNEFVGDKTVDLKLQSDSLQYNYTFVPGDKQYTLRVGALPVGKYTWVASTQLNGKKRLKQGSFIVEGFDLELLDLTAKADVLKAIATKSGGKAFSGKKYMRLVDAFLQSDSSKPIERTTSKKRTPIDLLWLFVLLVLTTSVELFIRRQAGLN